MKKMLVIVLLFCIGLIAQEKSSEDTWNQLKYFSGNWKGTSSGKTGNGKGERSYKFVMNDNYLFVKNKMHFEPLPNKTEGEVHEDWSVYSIDSRRQKYVLRQFNSEGFVNQFTLDSVSVNGKEMYWNLESSENSPPDFDARLVVIVKNEDEFEERFEMRSSGDEFSSWMTNVWKREKNIN
jgi:hypothetical protein